MKTRIIKLVLLAFLITFVTEAWSQTDKSEKTTTSRIPLLNENAPAFVAESTNGTIEFPADYGSKWKIIFSHPADFTPVCTSELLQLAKMQKEFKDINVQLIVVSTDDLKRHKAWVQSMEEILVKENNPVKIKFPIIDDSKFNIGWKYGMLTPSPESYKAVRGVYIVDPENKVKAITFYPMEVGRNIEEIKRMVLALQTAEKNTVLTPVNWKPGDNVLLPYPKSVNNYNPSKEAAFYMLYTKLEE
jgi:peroxiredoxin 2/4